MSNPTTPFSWQMPTATDLVTDLPANFEVFGQAVATSMADLLGGTTGQLLAKNSNTNMDFTWSSQSLVPQTTAPIAGNYYLSPQSTVTNGTGVVNVTYYLPIFVPVTTTYDRIACMSFTSFSGTASIRLGIFNNLNGAPGTVLLDAGTVAVSAASTMSAITISQSLPAGIYFLAANTVTAAATNIFYRYTNTAGNPLLGTTRNDISTANAYMGFTQNVNVTAGFATAVSPALSVTTNIMTAIRAA